MLCYDHSRVHLPEQEDDPSSDYINANFVDGYMQKDAYICAQGKKYNVFVVPINLISYAARLFYKLVDVAITAASHKSLWLTHALWLTHFWL